MSSSDHPTYNDPNPYNVPNLRTLAVMARVNILRDQALVPVLLLWRSRGTLDILSFYGLGEQSPEGRAQTFYQFGIDAFGSPNGRIVRVIWICESWSRVLEPGEPLPRTIPDVPTDEVLIQACDPNMGNPEIMRLRIVRDLNHRIINLNEIQESSPVHSFTGGPIDVFLQGYNSVRRRTDN